MIDFLKVAEVIERSPQDIKSLLFSSDIGDLLYGLADIYDMDEEKTMQMVDEVGYVILGLKDKIIFFDSLLQIGINEKPARVIAEEVRLQIFSELEKINATEAGEQERVVVPQPPPVHYQPPTPVPAPIPQPAAPQAPAPTPQQPAMSPAWKHTRPAAPSAPPLATSTPAATPAHLPPEAPPAISQYQKPLTSVPQYRNANLYQKAEEGQVPKNPPM